MMTVSETTPRAPPLIIYESPEDSYVQYYTVYTKNQQRIVVAGETMEEAFLTRFSKDNLDVIDFIDSGITNKVYNKRKKEWVSR